jgi:nitroreductase
MEFSEIVRKRRMIREYSNTSIEPEVIERILSNALRAPSAGFSQVSPFSHSLNLKIEHGFGHLCLRVLRTHLAFKMRR